MIVGALAGFVGFLVFAYILCAIANIGSSFTRYRFSGKTYLTATFFAAVGALIAAAF